MDIENTQPEQVQVLEVSEELVPVEVELDVFDRMTDRELLLTLNRKLAYFEALFAQFGEASQANPMMKMMFGKMFGK